MILTALILGGLSAGAVAFDDPVRLTVRIAGLESSGGSVALALFDSGESFDQRDPAVDKIFLPVENGGCEWVLDGLSPGEYAVMAFHDRNANGELDKNKLGIPQEPYGFSQGARGKFGPPKFKRARFQLDGDAVIELDLR